MPYKSIADEIDYFENYETIKPFSHWAAQQEEYLKEMLGVKLYEWVTKEAESLKPKV